MEDDYFDESVQKSLFAYENNANTFVFLSMKKIHRINWYLLEYDLKHQNQRRTETNFGEISYVTLVGSLYLDWSSPKYFWRDCHTHCFMCKLL